MSEASTRTIADVLTDTLILDIEDRRDAVAWARTLGSDVARAVAECPRASWLVALAFELGARDQVEDWWSAAKSIPPAEYRGPTLRESIDVAPMAFALDRARPSRLAEGEQRMMLPIELLRKLDPERLGGFLHSALLGVIIGWGAGRKSSAAIRRFGTAAGGISIVRETARDGRWGATSRAQRVGVETSAPEPRGRTVAEVLADTPILEREERGAAAAWGRTFGADVARAVAECPRPGWLVALACELGEGDQIADWCEAAKKLAPGEHHGPTLRASLDVEAMAFWLGRPQRTKVSESDRALMERAIERVRVLDTERLQELPIMMRYAVITGRTVGRMSRPAARRFATTVQAVTRVREVVRHGHS